MKILREIVAEQMVEVHRISPELAAYHVRQMMPSEVKRRFLFYVRNHRKKGGASLEENASGVALPFGRQFTETSSDLRRDHMQFAVAVTSSL